MYREYGEVTATRGKEHKYLGMKIEFEEDHSVEIDMRQHIDDMLKDFPIKFKSDRKCAFPAGKDMFSKDTSKILSMEKRELFHSFVARVLFVAKRSRLDPQPIEAALCARTRAPNESDWNGNKYLLEIIAEELL